jgi:gluconokinase
MICVLMGVSGAGKTTLGVLLAQKTGAEFADADDYHPAANKHKMAAGQPLNDADRQPWLETLNGVLKQWFAERASGVMACSALKQSYRTTLAAGMPEGAVMFCMLEVPEAVLQQRLAERRHEFMNPALLKSQLETLEVSEDEITVRNEGAPEAVVEEILRRLAEKEKAA